MPWIAAVSVVIVWSETFISSKVILENGLSPADVFFYRFSIAYLCMLCFSHRRFFGESVKDELLFLLLGLSGGSCYFLAENTSLKLSTASNTAIFVGSAPLITALLSALFGSGEKLNARNIVGSVMAFVGMSLVVYNGEVVLELNPAGDVLAFGAALIWGAYTLILRKVTGRYDVTFITRKVFFYGLATILLYFLFVEPINCDLEVLSRPSVLFNILYLGLVASLVCYLVWNWALGRLGAVRTTNLIYVQCLFTMTFAHFILGETITWMAIAGTLVLVVGMMNALSN